MKDMNFVELAGKVAGWPAEPKKTKDGTYIYDTKIEVPRNSGVIDSIPVRISSEERVDLEGEYLNLVGTFASYNMISDEKKHLKLIVLVKNYSVVDEKHPAINSIKLEGHICKPPYFRKTPFGKHITDVVLASNRNTVKSDYVPTIFWHENARMISNYLVGTYIALEGRIQSREYTKRIGDGKTEKRIAYEVSASNFCVIEDTTEEKE